MLSFLTRQRQTPPESKRSRTGPLVALSAAGRAVWTPRDYASLTRQAYMTNAVAHRAVRMIAESAAAIPFLVMENSQRLMTHPVLDLLAQPNPGQSGRELMEAFYGNLQTAGNSYLEAVTPPADMAPRELHALRPDRMRVIPGENGWPAGYEYHVSGRSVRFNNETDQPPILHLKSFHPLDDHYGLSPLEAAAMAIDLHNSAAVWNKALLDNAARPSGAIVYNAPDGHGHLTDGQYRRLTDELETHHQGARNAGRPMLLEGGLDWKPMGFSPADMEFLKAKENAAREIALAFGVPPMLLGLPGDNTYSNYQEANRAFYRQTVLPLVTKTAAALSGWLGDRFGEAVTLTPDLDALPALASERDAYWSRIAEADFLTRAEKRRLLGFPAQDDAG